MTILTLQTLIDAEACRDQRDIFERRFGQQVDVTPELCVSVAPLFDWEWAAENLLSADAYKAYLDATEDAPARKAYLDATAPALKAYRDATAAARKAYRDAAAAALKAYRGVAAAAFGRAYCQ